MIVTVHAMDRDMLTCRVHDAHDRRTLTFTRECEAALVRGMGGAEVDVTIDRGRVVRADVVIGRVRP